MLVSQVSRKSWLKEIRALVMSQLFLEDRSCNKTVKRVTREKVLRPFPQKDSQITILNYTELLRPSYPPFYSGTIN